MGRKPKLSDEQWNDVAARLARGEKAADLAREFGVARSTISERLAERVQKIKTIANQAVKVESDIRSLTVSEQMITFSVIDDLKAMSTHLGSAGRMFSAAANRLGHLVGVQMEKVDPIDPMASMDTLRTVGALTELANKASTIPLNLLAANKKTVERINDAPPEVTVPIDAYLEARARVVDEF